VSDARWRWVALLAVTAVVSYLCRVNVTVVGEPIMREFGLTQAQMGRAFSAFGVGYALCMIPGGVLADRWGTRRVLLIASAAWALVTLALASAGAGLLAPLGIVGSMLVLRFALGVAESPTFPAAALGTARWVGADRLGRANGVVLAAIGLGSAIAPPLLTWLMTNWGWRLAVAVTAAPPALVALVWLGVREPVPTATARERSAVDEPAGRSPLRTGNFTLLTASYTLQGYVGYIFVFWFYLYLVQERGFALLEGAFLASLPWVLSIVSIPLGGWVSDRLCAGRLGATWGRRLVPLTCLVGGGVLLTLGARTLDPVHAALYLALSTAAVLAVEGPFWATMLSIAGRRAGTGGGVMNVGSNLGGLVSPALTPVIAASIGWENALHVAAVLAVVAGLMWLGITAGSDER
jgi:ACS family glucarate transporter-like MFS transporter